MKKNTTRLYREAVRATKATLGTVARESGYARPTLDSYMREKPPSRAAVLKLADALEARADRLADYAARLREAAGERDPDAASPPRRGRARHR
jgi:hypothetical protein